MTNAILNLRATRLLATAALLASVVVGTAALPVAAEGPCGVPIYSGDVNRVGNLVFVDTDDDGDFEPADGEVGLPGVTVELWDDVDFDGVFEPTGDDAGGLECTTTTNAGGNYWFHDVASGIYFVAVSGGVPTDHQSSTGATTDAVTDNTDDGVPTVGYAAVSDAFTLNGSQPTAEAEPGDAPGTDESAADAATVLTSDADSNLTIDFGFSPLPAPECMGLGNRVWLDLNNDGIANGAEPGIDGVTVELFAATAAGSPTGAALDSTTTTDGGYYLFSCVDPGRYVVVIDADNFTDGGPLTGLNPTIEGPAGDQANDGAAAANGDVLSDAVVLEDDGAPVAEPDKPNDGSRDFDSPTDADVNTEIDFGFSGLTLGNRVWNETVTTNGIQDAGEPGIAAVAVELWAANGSGPIGAAPLATTNTDGSGYYLFAGLEAGDYVVRIPASNFNGPLSGLVSTPGNGTAPDADLNPADMDDNGDGPDAGPVDSLPVTLAAATEPTGERDTASAEDSLPSDDNANVTVDFGFVDTDLLNPNEAGLGDLVWIDADSDGVQDAGEKGVAGVRVRLRDAAGNELATTTTDTNGNYRFDELTPGTYSVCFDLATLPADMTPTTMNVGADDAADSDPGADGCTETTTLDAGEFDPTLDLGIRTSPTATQSIDLAIDKTGASDKGKTTWTLVVTNNGPDVATNDIIITDVLPSDVTYESASGTGFTCAFAASTSTVECTYSGDLSNGQTATLQIVTTMKVASDCNVTNTARVSSSGASAVDTNVANNTDTTTLTGVCVRSGGTTRPSLPVTGTSAAVLLGLALFLGIGGWRLNAYNTQLKATRLRQRLGE